MAKTTLEAAGLARITVVYLDERGTLRTDVHVVSRKALRKAVRRIRRLAVT